MRGRRPRRVGGVRPRPAHAAPRARSCTPSGSGRSRRAAAPSSRASWRCSPAAASSSRRSATTRSGTRRPARLAELGIDVHVAVGRATRRAWTHVDAAGERTITVLGDKLLPAGPLPLDGLRPRLLRLGRAGGAALRAPRALPRRDRARAADAAGGGVELDLLVASANDPGRALRRLAARAASSSLTDGANGGTLDGVPLRRGAAPARSSTPTAPAIPSPLRSRSRSPAATSSRTPRSWPRAPAPR